MLKQKSYFLFFIASIFYLTVSFFVDSNKVVVNFYDVYYVIAFKHLLILFSVLLALPFIFFFVLDSLKIYFSRTVTIYQFVLLLIVSNLLILINHFSNKFELAPKSFENIINIPNYNSYLLITILILILLQIFFIINIFVILVNKIRLQNASKNNE